MIACKSKLLGVVATLKKIAYQDQLEWIANRLKIKDPRDFEKYKREYEALSPRDRAFIDFRLKYPEYWKAVDEMDRSTLEEINKLDSLFQFLAPHTDKEPYNIRAASNPQLLLKLEPFIYEHPEIFLSEDFQYFVYNKSKALLSTSYSQLKSFFEQTVEALKLRNELSYSELFDLVRQGKTLRDQIYWSRIKTLTRQSGGSYRGTDEEVKAFHERLTPKQKDLVLKTLEYPEISVPGWINNQKFVDSVNVNYLAPDKTLKYIYHTTKLAKPAATLNSWRSMIKAGIKPYEILDGFLTKKEVYEYFQYQNEKIEKLLAVGEHAQKLFEQQAKVKSSEPSNLFSDAKITRPSSKLFAILENDYPNEELDEILELVDDDDEGGTSQDFSDLIETLQIRQSGDLFNQAPLAAKFLYPEAPKWMLRRLSYTIVEIDGQTLPEETGQQLRVLFDWMRKKQPALEKSYQVRVPGGEVVTRYNYARVDEIRAEDLTEGVQTSTDKVLDIARERAARREERENKEILSKPAEPVAIFDFWIPEGLKQLTTDHEIVLEGQIMDHCVGGYVDSAKRGDCYIFHAGPERPAGSTVEVRLDNEGFINVVQQFGYKDSDPKPEEVALVEKWVKEFKVWRDRQRGFVAHSTQQTRFGSLGSEAKLLLIADRLRSSSDK